MFTIGNLLVCIILLVTILSFMMEVDYVRLDYAYMAKLFAFLAITSLSLSFILSSRTAVIEYLFRGLDKAYNTHQIIGKLSLLFMILHPIFLTASYGVRAEVLKTFYLPFYSTWHTLGLLSVLIVLILVFITLCSSILYNVWLNTHKFMILALPPALVHSLKLGSEIQNGILAYWISAFVLLGIISYLYKAILFGKIGPKSTYVVDSFTKKGNVTELVLEPLGKTREAKPGQFYFLGFPDLGRELHPFSVSKIFQDKRQRYSIKMSGDYTSEKVLNLRMGDRAILYGPYGSFMNESQKPNADCLLVAGGIGVTPFLSFINGCKDWDFKGHVRLLWSVSTPEDAIYAQEMEEISSLNELFDYEVWISSINGRVTTSDIISLFAIEKEKLKDDIDIFICGPIDFMYGTSKGFENMGLHASKIHLEEFNLK